MEALEQQWISACLDGSDLSDSIVDYAAWIARRVNSPLEFLHSIQHSLLLEHIDSSGNLVPNMRENLMATLSADEEAENKSHLQEGKALLQAAKDRVAGTLPKEVITKQRHGTLTETLMDLEDEIRVLVVGFRGKATPENLTGISEQLEESIRALHKPIFIVNGDFIEPKSLMLAYNNTEGARKALDMICRSPLYEGMTIHCVQALKPDAKDDGILAQATQQLTQAGRTFETAQLRGDPQTELLAYQAKHNLDMTVMGAFNHGKLRSLFFGSFTLKMLKHNNKPVLLIR